MDLFYYNQGTNKIKYNTSVGEFMFFDIIENIKNEKDLKFVVSNLCENLSVAVHDWYTEHNIKDNFDHCEIDLIFDLEEQ